MLQNILARKKLILIGLVSVISLTTVFLFLISTDRGPAPFDWMDGPSPTCQVLATEELPGPYYLDVVLIAGAMREPYQNEEGQWILPIYYCDNPTSGEPIVVEYLLGGDDVAMGLMQGEDGYVVPYDETKRNKGTMTPVDMTVSAFVKQHLALDELYPLILITETSGLPFPDCLEKDDCRHLVEVFADMAEKHQHLLSLISGERTDPITELIGDIPGIFQAKRYEGRSWIEKLRSITVAPKKVAAANMCEEKYGGHDQEPTKIDECNYLGYYKYCTYDTAEYDDKYWPCFSSIIWGGTVYNPGCGVIYTEDKYCQTYDDDKNGIPDRCEIITDLGSRKCGSGGTTPSACSNFTDTTVCGYSEYPTVYQGPPYPDEDEPFVTELQKSLNLLGHNAGGEDGLYGRNTARGVSSYAGGAGSSFGSWQRLETDVVNKCSFVCAGAPIEKTVSIQTNPVFTPGITIDTSEGVGTTNFTVKTTDIYPDGDKFFIDISDSDNIITRDGKQWEFDVWQIDDSQRTPGDDRVNFILDDDSNRMNRVAIAHYKEGSSTLEVNLTADPTTIDLGATSTLTWTVDGGPPASCTATGGWSGSRSTAGGNQNVSPIITTSYTITCDGVPDTATVTVTTDPKPPENPVEVNVGSNKNENSCYDAEWAISGVDPKTCIPSSSPYIMMWNTTVSAQLADDHVRGEVELCDIVTATTLTLTCGAYSDSAGIILPFIREINPGETSFNFMDFLRDLFPGFVKSSYALS